MPAKLTPEERESRILAKIAGKYELLGQDGEDKGSATRYKLRCPVDGREWSTSYVLINGGRVACSRCSGLEPYTPETLTETLNQKIGDKYDFRFDVFAGKETRLFLKCKVDGYEWETSFHSIVNKHNGKGTGCPLCAGNAPYTPETLTSTIRTLSGGKYDFRFDVFAGKETRLFLKCKVDGCDCEWESSFPSVVYAQSGCPRCACVERYTPETLAAALNEKIGDKWEWSYDTFDRSYTIIKLKCKVDGYEWKARADGVLRGTTGCSRCYGNEKYTPETLAAALNEKIGDKWEWSYDTFAGRDTRLFLKCKVDGHEWSTRVDNIMCGSGCPACAEYGFNPAKTGDFYVNIGTLNNAKFTKHGITQQKGNQRIDSQRRSSVGVSDYRQIWRETFENGEDALHAEKYFDSFNGKNVPRENLPDGYTETITDVHPCQIALNLIFGFHRPPKKKD